MMARIEGRELSAHIKLHFNGEALSENFIPTAICTADAPTGTHGGAAGAGRPMVSLPSLIIPVHFPASTGGDKAVL